MKILAEDLQRLCYNAIQFSSKDSSLKGVVLFAGGAGVIEVYASDDYVAMNDRAPATDLGEGFYLGLKEVKELEKWLRDKEGEVELEVVTGTDEADFLEISSPEYWTLQIVSEPPDFSAVVDVIHSEPNPMAEDYYPASREPFAIRAERFSKFRLLKTPESPSCKDGYPVDFLWDGRLIRWRCGPFLKGVIGPLTRHSFIDKATGEPITGIKELYLEESEVLW